MAGILLFGLIFRKSGANCSPLPISTPWMLYGSAISSSAMWIFCPFGVGQECSSIGLVAIITLRCSLDASDDPASPINWLCKRAISGKFYRANPFGWAISPCSGSQGGGNMVRHRYFRLASPRVGDMLECIMAVAAIEGPVRYRPPSPRDDALRHARTCYNHLAGRLGVAIADAMIDHHHVVLDEDAGVLTDSGA